MTHLSAFFPFTYPRENKSHSLPVALEPRFRHGNDLHYSESSIDLENAVYNFKVGGEELLADSFNHLDTDDSVEGVAV